MTWKGPTFNKKQRRQGSRLLKILSVGKVSVSKKTDGFKIQ